MNGVVRSRPMRGLAPMNLLAVLVVSAAVVTGCGEDSGSELSVYEQARKGFDNATPAELEGLTDALIEKANAQAKCSVGRCEITYNGGDVLGAIISPEEELFEDQRYVWEIAFRDPKLEVLELTALGKATSTGGKTSTVPVLRITCNAATNDKINWDKVQVDGISELCIYQELVNFD